MITAPTEEAMLERALAMSMETGEDEPMIVQERSGGSASGATATATATAAAKAPEVDFNNMSEEEQIAFAMQMSMQDSAAEEKASASSPSSKEEAMDVDYSEVMNDPEFIQSVLENLPGVDPQSDAVRQAVGLVSKDSKDKDQKTDKDKNSKK